MGGVPLPDDASWLIDSYLLVDKMYLLVTESPNADYSG